MFGLGVFAFLFIGIVICRKMHQRYVLASYRYRVFALRDELRGLAIDKKIDSNSFAFEYFDKMFSRTISDAYYVTLFHIVAVGFRSPNILRNKEFEAQYAGALNSSNDVRRIVEKFYGVSAEYVFGQHWVTFNLFIKPVFKMAWGGFALRQRIKFVVERALVNSEGRPSFAYIRKH